MPFFIFCLNPTRRQRAGGVGCVLAAVFLILVWAPVAAAGPSPYAPAFRVQRAAGAGLFLVARRDLPDPNFRRSVVFLLQHGDGGTLGLIINRRSRISLAEAMPDLRGVDKTRHRLFFGGPVALGRLLLLLRNEKDSPGIQRITEDVSFSADREVLEALIARRKPENELRIYMGHAGWGAGQLNYELARGDWHVIDSDTKAIFSANHEALWEKLIKTLEPAGMLVHSTPGQGIRLRLSQSTPGTQRRE